MSAPVDRAGRLAGNDAAEMALWEQVFDHGTGELRLEREGRFWDAVATARRTGATGEGRCIAVIDAGFDLRFPQLQQRVHPASQIRSDTVAADASHGTRVALLARAVAPDAELLLLDVHGRRGITDEEVARAMRVAVSANADILNLSLEFDSEAEPIDTDWVDVDVFTTAAPSEEAFVGQVAAWMSHAEPYSDMRCPGRCAVCNALEQAPAETLVIAASGNSFDSTCPACMGRVTGVGFHRAGMVERDGVVFTTRGLPQTETKQFRSELSVEEPPGFYGTSFAAPLLSGFSALLPSARDLASMAWLHTAMTPVLWLANAQVTASPGELPPGAPHTLHQGLLKIASAVPPSHQHWEQAWVTEPCALCALLMIDWYDVFTSMMVATGVPESGVGIARIGGVLAPDVASVNANRGLACRRLAEKTADPDARRNLLIEAQNAYRQAVARGPGIVRYQTDLAEVTAALTAR